MTAHWAHMRAPLEDSWSDLDFHQWGGVHHPEGNRGAHVSLRSKATAIIINHGDSTPKITGAHLLLSASCREWGKEALDTCDCAEYCDNTTVNMRENNGQTACFLCLCALCANVPVKRVSHSRPILTIWKGFWAL